MGYLFDPANWEWISAEGFFNLIFLLEGFLINIEIALIAMLLSLFLGLGLTLMRLSKRAAIKVPAGIWIDVWRNLPLIFTMLYLALSIPKSWRETYLELVPGWLPEAYNTPFALAAILALTLYNSAVIAEIMRAGIQSLERGQGEAAAALGLPYWKAMRLIILPQGLRRMVPATVSQLITLMKDTSLISIIGMQEAIRHGRIVTNISGSPFTGVGVQAPLLHVFITVGLMFVLFNFMLSRLSKTLEIRERKRTGVTVERATGLEDQIAAEAEVVELGPERGKGIFSSLMRR